MFVSKRLALSLFSSGWRPELSFLPQEFGLSLLCRCKLDPVWSRSCCSSVVVLARKLSSCPACLFIFSSIS
jgi:hypothetical protein